MGNIISDSYDAARDAVRRATNAAVEAANQAREAALTTWQQTSGVTRDAAGTFSSVRTEAEIAAMKAGDAASVVAPVDREQLRSSTAAFAPAYNDARDFVNSEEGSAFLPMIAGFTPQGRKNLASLAAQAAPIAGNIVAPGIGGQLGQLAGGVANNYFGDPGTGSEGAFQFEEPPQEAPSGVGDAFGGIAPARAAGGSSMTTWIVLAAVAVAGIIIITKGRK